MRQQFTQKERDIETGLDYFGARYYAFLGEGDAYSKEGDVTVTEPLDQELMKAITSRFDIGGITAAALSLRCKPGNIHELEHISGGGVGLLGGLPGLGGGPLLYQPSPTSLDWLWWLYERELERLRHKDDDLLA